MTELSYAQLSVIVIDDVRAMRSILRAMLRNLGIQNVVEAGDGTEALEILRGQRKDLAITDMFMAPMDGIKFTRQLRRPESLNAATPVLMISAHNQITRVKEAMAAGVSAFLLKPVRPLALTKKVQALMSQPVPLVQAATYHGPDRRRRTAWVRKDRRTGSQRVDEV